MNSAGIPQVRNKAVRHPQCMHSYTHAPVESGSYQVSGD